MSEPAPRLTFKTFPSGTIFVLSRYDSIGVLEADGNPAKNADLYIAAVDVTPAHRQKGIGSLLIKSTVRWVTEHYPQIASCSAALINPVAVPMFQKVFGDSVLFNLEDMS